MVNLKSLAWTLGSLMSLCLVSSCGGPGKLVVEGVGYQSINTKIPQPSPESPISPNAKILVSFAINQNGTMGVFIKNLTDEIMTVDQGKSFFIGPDGISKSYYDPNLRTTSTTSYNSTTNGVGFNFGAMAQAFGIGGPVGSLMGGLSYNGSVTSGTATTNSITIVNQREINIGPYGAVKLEIDYDVAGLGKKVVATNSSCQNFTFDQSPVHFSVCIYYRNEETEFQKIMTDFYLSSFNFISLNGHGKQNAALREIMEKKPDMLSQPWYLLYFPTNIPEVDTNDPLYDPTTNDVVFDYQVKGFLYNYQ